MLHMNSWGVIYQCNTWNKHYKLVHLNKKVNLHFHSQILHWSMTSLLIYHSETQRFMFTTTESVQGVQNVLVWEVPVDTRQLVLWLSFMSDLHAYIQHRIHVAIPLDWEATVICVRSWSHSHWVSGSTCFTCSPTPTVSKKSLAVWNLPLDQHKNGFVNLFRNLSICFSPPSGF